MRSLLKDVDLSLLNHKVRYQPRELETIPIEEESGQKISAFYEDFEEEKRERKSPAALFGSQGIGAVVLPLQLQSAIDLIIANSDKTQLHSDAKRLFSDNDSAEQDFAWETQYDTKYRSRVQAARHAERDGTAFVSVALPAHYSAIFSVFDHLRRRMEPGWGIDRVIDWGAATGSGLWAALYSFQKHSPAEDMQHREAANSTLETYIGIDKREGLVSIGKRLHRNVAEMGDLVVQWQKSFKTDDTVPRSEGQKTLALSAFMLTSQPTPLARKAMVMEMWESGAHTMVLIDHNTPAGFGAIAEAREFLLSMGRKEFEDPEAEAWPVRGAHVVAPCPHDRTCPLHGPGLNRFPCGFTQRIQRPSFLRLTKHSGVGHEDIEYSYVIIRRGPRPILATTSVGRVGDVGRRAAERVEMTPTELLLHEEEPNAPEDAARSPSELIVNDDRRIGFENKSGDQQPPADLEATLRHEAYQWPRLVFPPMKKSGHIILDSCTAEGKIMRITIPKSQGKQAYYDARKSSWGDIFPHPPKNPPQERFLTSSKGSDIGKRKNSTKSRDRPTYNGLSGTIREQRKKSKVEYARVRDEQSAWRKDSE